MNCCAPYRLATQRQGRRERNRTSDPQDNIALPLGYIFDFDNAWHPYQVVLVASMRRDTRIVYTP